MFQAGVWNNEKKVASVEIELPELKPFEGLQFVDTPGLGSVFKHNTAAALDWLPYVGVALVAVAVDPPLSENDVELIRELKLYTPRIALLLTKADLVSATDRKEIEEFVGREIKRELGSALELYPYSIQPLHSKLKKEFETRLLGGLRSKRAVTQTEILAHKIKSLIRQPKTTLLLLLRRLEN